MQLIFFTLLIYFTLFFFTQPLKAVCLLHSRHLSVSTSHRSGTGEPHRLPAATQHHTGLDAPPQSSHPPASMCGAACVNVTSMSFNFCLQFSYFIRSLYLFMDPAICSWNMSTYFKMRATVLWNLSNSRFLIWWPDCWLSSNFSSNSFSSGRFPTVCVCTCMIEIIHLIWR